MNDQHELLIPSSMRDRIKEAVIRLLQTADTHRLPVVLTNIADRMGWNIIPYQAAKEFGVTLASDDGFTIAREKNGQREYIILYNEAIGRGRIRWTIAHEMGHIMLGHFEQSKQKKIFEAEANYFAKNLLAPMAVIAKRGITGRKAIAACCDISMEAAVLREKDCARHSEYYQKYGATDWDKKFLEIFE